MLALCHNPRWITKVRRAMCFISKGPQCPNRIVSTNSATIVSAATITAAFATLRVFAGPAHVKLHCVSTGPI